MPLISISTVISLLCTVVILVCLLNNFVVCSHSPTLYDEVVRWPHTLLKNIALVYFLLIISAAITYAGVQVFTITFGDVVAIIKENPQRYVFWNYIFLEFTLLLIDAARKLNMQTAKTISYFMWCLMFAPVICLFDLETIDYASKLTALILFTSTVVVYFWNVHLQTYIMRRIVFVMLGIYIPLTASSVLLLIFGFPHNIFGSVIIFLVLHLGFLFYILLFVFSTHIFINFARQGADDFMRNAIELYVCAMHVFGRIMILSTYKLCYTY